MLIDFQSGYWLISAFVVLLVLTFHYVSIWPARLAQRWLGLDDKAPVMLTWGGLHGELSIALVLSITNALPYKNLLVMLTYGVVFSQLLGKA